MSLASVLYLVQVFFAVVIGVYFWNLVRSQTGSRAAQDREARKETDRLGRLRQISLSEPLAERVRPRCFDDLAGQEEGIKALEAALCGPNPQHVIIYGPPGVGKTAAARLVLEKARENPRSPFGAQAKFVEIDATTARFDERGIADPLIGSVHDPIYQGAGPLGVSGIPQPRPGAVTRAHGGILFLDEIGELHPVQMNKLLKVLEDRKVWLDSAYYNSEDRALPAHIRDIFENGLPADFRLVGATTRSPHEIPAAIRSRCMEVFFRHLYPAEIGAIAQRAANKLGVSLPAEGLAVIQRHAHSGREAVNIVQMSSGLALNRGEHQVLTADVQWVIATCQFAPRPDQQAATELQVGVVSGLAVLGPGAGALLEVEAAARPTEQRTGQVTVTGIVEEEELSSAGRVLRRRATARAAVDNVITALRQLLPTDPGAYDLHINFPGGIPVDGPSAGVTMAVAIVSAMLGRPVRPQLALTGEVSVRGRVRPVGGVVDKLEAARHAGCRTVIIPAENWQDRFADFDLQVIPVRELTEALDLAMVPGFSSAPVPETQLVGSVAAAGVAAASVATATTATATARPVPGRGLSQASRSEV